MINNLKYIDFFTKDKAINEDKLILLIYLSDWQSCLEYDKKLTTFEYIEIFNVPTIKNFDKYINYNNYLEFGGKIKNSEIKHEYNNEELKVLNFVKEITMGKTIQELKDYIGNLYPFNTLQRYKDLLDLETLSNEYKERILNCVFNRN